MTCLAWVRHQVELSFPWGLFPSSCVLIWLTFHFPSRLLVRLFPLAHAQAFQPLGPCSCCSSYQECLSSLSLPPLSILLLSLFNSNAASSRKALLRGARFQQTRTQIQRHQKGQISACGGFGSLLLGFSHTRGASFSPAPQYTRVSTRWR